MFENYFNIIQIIIKDWEGLFEGMVIEMNIVYDFCFFLFVLESFNMKVYEVVIVLVCLVSLFKLLYYCCYVIFLVILIKIYRRIEFIVIFLFILFYCVYQV